MCVCSFHVLLHENKKALNIMKSLHCENLANQKSKNLRTNGNKENNKTNNNDKK